MDGPFTAAFTTAYRADGQPASIVAPNGNTTNFAYDTLGRETGRSTAAVGPVNRAVYALAYNRAGQVLSETSTITGDPTNGLTTYIYDPLERLTSFTRAASSNSYAWQAFPNRASVQVGAGTPVTTTYDAANRPTSDSVGGTYASDADGRLRTRPGQRLGWDNLGTLVTVRPGTGVATAATYTYDPLDRLRTVDHGASGRTRFRYVGLTTSVAQTIDDLTSSVIRGVGTDWTGEALVDWTGAGANVRFYGTNAHHDLSWTGSSSGTVSATLRYDPWGSVTASTGSSLPDVRFQGSWFDTTTDLAWVISRWYAPSLGRFISEDSLLGEPSDPPSRHLYSYTQGEPIGRWDADGRFWYKVRRGNTLWGLAARYLGSGTKWRRIYKANRSLIKHPPLIRTGWCIWIPRGGSNHGCHKNLPDTSTDPTPAPGPPPDICIKHPEFCPPPGPGGLFGLGAIQTAGFCHTAHAGAVVGLNAVKCAIRDGAGQRALTQTLGFNIGAQFGASEGISMMISDGRSVCDQGGLFTTVGVELGVGLVGSSFEAAKGKGCDGRAVTTLLVSIGVAKGFNAAATGGASFTWVFQGQWWMVNAGIFLGLAGLNPWPLVDQIYALRNPIRKLLE